MSFFVSFRILCWQLLWFQKERAETLHPDYFNCNRCHREEKDLRRGCPRCPLTELLQFSKDETLRLILKERCPFPEGYTIDTLMRLHSRIVELLSKNKNRIQKSWDTKTAELARIYLSEKNHKSMVEDFERLQRLKK